MFAATGPALQVAVLKKHPGLVTILSDGRLWSRSGVPQRSHLSAT